MLQEPGKFKQQALLEHATSLIASLTIQPRYAAYNRATIARNEKGEINVLSNYSLLAFDDLHRHNVSFLRQFYD